MDAIAEDKATTLMCYEDRDSKNLVNFCYESMALEINGLPQYQPESVIEDRWIPCSERLPEKDKTVLVSYEDRYLGAGNGVCTGMYVYSWGKWDISDYDDENDFKVIAWQPFPPAYKEGGV